MKGIGLCKLTRSQGKLIKSHIIPKALTRPEEAGRPFIQSGAGTHPIRRWDSWYDPRLVTQEGEDILTALDTPAIDILRRNKLVWSSWGPMQRLPTADHQTLASETGWGVRKIEGIEPKCLRLFFLSILWRAAASGLPEFKEVKIPFNDLETLRQMIISQNVEPISFYPTTLIQLSTLGQIHNFTPLIQEKTIPGFGEGPDKHIPIFRFYFDGLIAHVHNHANDGGFTESLGELIVGANTTLMVSTVTYEESFQRKNLEVLKDEAFGAWPDVMAKLLK